MEEKITIKIMPDGRVLAETDGVNGPKCVDYMKLIEDIVEGKIVKEWRKPEFDAIDQAVLNNAQNQRIKE
ncbi:MAG TPA: DUF2997 domain-containing protein [bacterium]|nr:DUF2997 domain-containing protein [bacterium]